MTASAEEILVGDLGAEFLQQIGVSTTFGVISIHNIPMLDAIGTQCACDLACEHRLACCALGLSLL